MQTKKLICFPFQGYHDNANSNNKCFSLARIPIQNVDIINLFFHCQITHTKCIHESIHIFFFIASRPIQNAENSKRTERIQPSKENNGDRRLIGSSFAHHPRIEKQGVEIHRYFNAKATTVDQNHG
jgi:hypothetical protein